MSESFTSTVKAGRMIQMFAFVNLGFALAVATAIAMISVSESDVTVVWDDFTFVWAGLVSLVYFLVGAAVKHYHTWAKITGAGLAVYSLLSIPIGTLIGVCALLYLAHGWKEATPAFVDAPA